MKIGNLNVIHSASFIIPEGESAWSEFTVGTWNVKLELCFLTSDEKGNGISIDPIEDYARITFVNWNNPIGTATKHPIELARTNTGEPLLLMVAHFKIGETSKLDIQVLLGGAE